MKLRIGFAYNERPSDDGEPPSSEPPSGAPPPEEPPSGAHLHKNDPDGGHPEGTVSSSHRAHGTHPHGPPVHGGLHDRYAEWDDAATIAAVESALRRAGDVVRLEADADFPLALRESRPDIVFNIAEGAGGPNREAHVPAICEFYGIAYTGSDPLTLALALDKRRAKEVFTARRVPTPRYRVAEAEAAGISWREGGRGSGKGGPGQDGGRWAASGRPDGRRPRRRSAAEELPLPVIVKPLYEGSSKGISERALCTTSEAVAVRVSEILDAYAQPALVEEFLPGREFTCAILGNGPSARALPLVEVRLDVLPAGAAPIYGYEAKWVWDTAQSPLDIFRCPAELDAPLARALEAASLDAFHALGCRDWARVDLRLDAAGKPHVLEINPLPGILPDPRQNSCFPKAARAAGIDYDDLIATVLRAGLARYGLGA